MKKIAILLSVFFFGFSQAQTPINETTQEEKQERKYDYKENPDARVFSINEQKENTTSITKEETLKNKKGYKRVNTALNKKIKAKKKEERKALKEQDRIFNKYIKESKKRRKKIKKQSK